MADTEDADIKRDTTDLDQLGQNSNNDDFVKEEKEQSPTSKSQNIGNEEIPEIIAVPISSESVGNVQTQALQLVTLEGHGDEGEGRTFKVVGVENQSEGNIETTNSEIVEGTENSKNPLLLQNIHSNGTLVKVESQEYEEREGRTFKVVGVENQSEGNIETTNSEIVEGTESSKDDAVLKIHSDGIPKMEVNSTFSTFVQLRESLERYQNEHRVQFIVKDSKLLSAESTRRIIPKVYHLVNRELLYHSITYCCKCHGELRQKSGTVRKYKARRLNCRAYLRFKLTADLQSLSLFDMNETHNHDIDPNTCQLPPRQQVYRLSRMRKRLLAGGTTQEQNETCLGDEGQFPADELKQDTPTYSFHDNRTEGLTARINAAHSDVASLIAAAIKDVNSVSSLHDVDYQPPTKSLRSDANGTEEESHGMGKVKTEKRGNAMSNDDEEDDDGENDDSDLDADLSPSSAANPIYHDDPYSPLDPESSSCDSDEEQFRAERYLLPYPIRLIGSAVQSSPELLVQAKQLIEIQKGNLNLEKRKLMLQTKQLELENAKLALEVKVMEKNMATELETHQNNQDTTIYLQG